jgi:hypothetical protein
VKDPRRDPNRRRAARVRVSNLVGYADRRSGRFYSLLGSAVTIDLSDSGVRLRTVEPLPIGSTITLDLKVASDVHRLDGRVIWGKETVRDEEYEFGIEFEELEPKLKESLRLYVSVKQTQRDSGP